MAAKVASADQTPPRSARPVSKAMRRLNRRSSAIVSWLGEPWRHRRGKCGAGLGKLGIRIAQQAVGEQRGIPQRQRREIGGGGENGVEQLA